jgi:hypothetical protein
MFTIKVIEVDCMIANSITKMLKIDVSQVNHYRELSIHYIFLL